MGGAESTERQADAAPSAATASCCWNGGKHVFELALDVNVRQTFGMAVSPNLHPNPKPNPNLTVTLTTRARLACHHLAHESSAGLPSPAPAISCA